MPKGLETARTQIQVFRRCEVLLSNPEAGGLSVQTTLPRPKLLRGQEAKDQLPEAG